MAAWGKNPPKNAQVTPTDYVVQDSWGVDPPPDIEVVRPLSKQTQQLPYRGSEYHGVNPNLAGDPPDINNNVFDQTAVVIEKQEAPERAEVPVPVRIVSDPESDYEYSMARTTGMMLSGVSITIVSHMRTRTNLVVLNNGAVTVLISDSQQPMQPNSYTIPVGGTFTSKGQNRFYAVTSDGSPQPISILEEYTVSSSRKQQA